MEVGKIEKILKNTLLYDFYAELLTIRQRDIYHMYYFEDMSLEEAGDKLGITRQAVHSSLRHTQKKLETIERKLGMVNFHGAAKGYIEALGQALEAGDVAEGKRIVAEFSELV